MRIFINLVTISILLTFLIFAVADFGSKFITLSPEQKAEADNWMVTQTYKEYLNGK